MFPKDLSELKTQWCQKPLCFTTATVSLRIFEVVFNCQLGQFCRKSAAPKIFEKFWFWGSLGLLLWHQAVCQNVAFECLYFRKVNKNSWNPKREESSLFYVAASCSHERVERKICSRNAFFPLRWAYMSPSDFRERHFYQMASSLNIVKAP